VVEPSLKKSPLKKRGIALQPWFLAVNLLRRLHQQAVYLEAVVVIRAVWLGRWRVRLRRGRAKSVILVSSGLLRSTSIKNDEDIKANVCVQTTKRTTMIGSVDCDSGLYLCLFRLSWTILPIHAPPSAFAGEFVVQFCIAVRCVFQLAITVSFQHSGHRRQHFVQKRHFHLRQPTNSSFQPNFSPLFYKMSEL